MTLKGKGLYLREGIYAQYTMSRKEANVIIRDMCKKENKIKVIISALITNEDIADWLILSTKKERPTYERVEFSELGIIPYGRSDFYAYRRRFIYIYKQLKEKEEDAKSNI